ncbi:MAG: cation transporting ATPase C-terminal domain-containing protein [Paracoccaceae bacterium]
MSATRGDIWTTLLFAGGLAIRLGIDLSVRLSLARATKMSSLPLTRQALTLSEGREILRPVDTLSEGDLVRLRPGTRAPADLQIAAARELTIEEGSEDAADHRLRPDGTEIAPAALRLGPGDMCAAGTLVLAGEGEGTVSSGVRSPQMTSPASALAGKETVPLWDRLMALAGEMTTATGAALALVALSLLVNADTDPLTVALQVVAIGAATLPDSLRAAFALAYATGARRVGQARVFVRRLGGFEALGSTSFVCADTVGFVTEAEFACEVILLPGGARFEVDGEGVSAVADTGAEHELTREGRLARLLESVVPLQGLPAGAPGPGGGLAVTGISTEIRRLLEKVGIEPTSADRTEILVSPETGLPGALRAVAVFADGTGETRPAARGTGPRVHAMASPDRLLPLCTRMADPTGTVPIDREALEAEAETLYAQGHWVIAVACDPAPRGGQPDRMNELVFLGLIAFRNAVRPEVKGALDRCRQAGLRVALLSDAQPTTAKAVAARLGLNRAHQPAVTGALIRDAARKSEATLDNLILQARVFAEVGPMEKALVVGTFARNNYIVAVTGRGAADRKAFERAHAGIAVGEPGTDVAREHADVALASESFDDLITGIEQSRAIFYVIRKVLSLALTFFAALTGAFLLSASIGIGAPLTPAQVVWLGLFTLAPAATALALERREGRGWAEPPRKSRLPLVSAHEAGRIAVTGLTTALTATAVFGVLSKLDDGPAHGQAVALVLMVLGTVVHMISRRSETRSILVPRRARGSMVMRMAGLATVATVLLVVAAPVVDPLGLASIEIAHVPGIVLLAAVPLLAEELYKILSRTRHRTLWRRFNRRRRE